MTANEALAEVAEEIRSRGKDGVVFTHCEETVVLADEVIRLRGVVRDTLQALNELLLEHNARGSALAAATARLVDEMLAAKDAP